MKQRQNFTGAKGLVSSICKNISRVVDATCQKFQHEVQVQQVASREEVEIWDMHCPSLMLKDHIIRILYTTSRSGASENSSALQQLRHERELFDSKLGSFPLEQHLCKFLS